jgi:hypothetical protein
MGTPSGEGQAASDAEPGKVRGPGLGVHALEVLDDAVVRMTDLASVRDEIAATIVENQRLRGDNIRLSKALVGRDDASLTSAMQLALERSRVSAQQVQDLLEENTEIQSRLLELEELNNSMMSMYVSSFRLHATLVLDEVVLTIVDILVNFIGARAYAVLMANESGTLDVVAEARLEGRLPSHGIEPRGVLAESLGSRTAYVHTSERPAREGVLAAVPLTMGKECVGALIVYELLTQKERLLKNDVELLSLLGGHAASALVSAQLYARADRKLKTLQGMIDLLGTSDD